MGSWRGIIYLIETERDGFKSREEARDWAIEVRKKLQKDNPNKEYYFDVDQDGAEYEEN